MKKHLYLMPVLALSMAAFALAGCDDNQEEQAAAPAATEEVVAESVMPVPQDAPVEVTATIAASDAVAYATAPGASNGAVFVTLQNPQDVADSLVSATADVSSTVEIHQTAANEDGTTSMTKVSSIEILPGQFVRLEPDGYHLMLMGLTSPLTEGQTFNTVLTFTNAGAITVPVRVVAAGDIAGAEEMHEGHDHNHDHEAVEEGTPVEEETAPSTEENTSDTSVESGDTTSDTTAE